MILVIIIVSINKCNASVVMEKLKYSGKLAKQFGFSIYSKVKMDSTLKTKRKLLQILNKNKD